MAFQFTCPNCQKNRSLDESLRGKKIKCSCGTVTRAYEIQSSVEQPVVAVPVQPVAPVDLSVAAEHTHANIQTAIPVEPVPYGLPVPTQKPQKRFVSPTYSKQSIANLFIAMVSGTLAILFAFLVFVALGDFVYPLLDQPDPPRHSSFRPSEPSASLIGARVFAIIGIAVSVLYTISGLGQFAASWTQFVTQSNRFAWVDIAMSAISVIAIVTLIAAFIYINYQIMEYTSAQRKIYQLQTDSVFAPPDARERMESGMNTTNKMINTLRWTVFRELMVHLLIPSAVLGLSLFRFFRNSSE